MKKSYILFFLLLSNFCTYSQLKLSDDKHYLVTSEGKPFFWLGDTAWELFHRLSLNEAKTYFQNRAEKGFNVIQAVLLAELDGLNTPNRNGDRPLIDNDPTKPNNDYFLLADSMIEAANELGLYVALLPSWGDKWFKDRWGVGPEVFNPENAAWYGSWLARRYENKNIVWVLGGDRPINNDSSAAIIRAMAKGIRSVDKTHLLTFHPNGRRSSYEFFPEDQWLDFHMSQTGHAVGSPDYETNTKAYALKNVKPHINGEPNYEDHPNNWNPVQYGWMDQFDTREAAYWNMLSGGAGHTYGNHNIWQMWTENREPVNGARTRWNVAMDHPGAFQMGYLRRMFEKRNWQRLRNDQSVIIGDNPKDSSYKVAAVSADKDFLMLYIPLGSKTTVDLSVIYDSRLRGWWFNPRDGYCIPLGDFANTGQKDFSPLSGGRGSDWLLIVDAASKNYPEPTAY